MESETTIINPLHFMVVQRAGTSWIFSGGEQVILNPRHVPVLLAIDPFSLRLNTMQFWRMPADTPGYPCIYFDKYLLHCDNQ
jgi:hypothetical protein